MDVAEYDRTSYNLVLHEFSRISSIPGQRTLAYVISQNGDRRGQGSINAAMLKNWLSNDKFM